MTDLVDPQAEEVSARHAYEIAREEMRAALRLKWKMRIQALPSEADLSTAEMMEGGCRGALMRMVEIATGEATEECVTPEGEVVTRKVSTSNQIRAAELILKLSMEHARLKAEAAGKLSPQPQLHVHMQPDPEVSREEKVKILRQLSRAG